MKSTPNCNACEAKCPGAKTPRLMEICSRYLPIISGWSIAELALAHADSLHKALSALPFKVKITDYLKEGS